MAVWNDLLTEHDRRVLAARPPRQQTKFGERPVLLVIDMNRDSVGEDRPIYEQLDKYPGACGPFAWAAIRYMKRLLPTARAAGIPVIYSKQIFKAIHDLPRCKDPTLPFSELNPLSELHPEVAPQPGDLLIEKQRPSVFFHTPLLYTLLNKKIDTLIITGNSTSGCVRATAVDAGNYFCFKVVVVEECVFDRIELSHKAALFDLQFKYCDVVSFDQVMSYITGVEEAKVMRAAV